MGDRAARWLLLHWTWLYERARECVFAANGVNGLDRLDRWLAADAAG